MTINPIAESSLRLLTRPDGIAVLTVDQPGSRANVLTRALWDELHAVLLTLNQSTACVGLILDSAKPNIFIAGADLKFLGSVPAPHDPAVRELMEFGLATLALLENLPFPTCAIIDGAALGGGLEVALACDYRLIGTNPKVELGLPEVKLGLIPGWGGTQRLPRIIGVAPAVDLMVTGTSLTGIEAIQLGLADGMVNQTTAEVLFASGEHSAKRTNKRYPLPHAEPNFLIDEAQPALAALRPVIARGTELPLDGGLALETAAFVGLAGSDDSRSRIAEFFASRKK